MKHLKPQRLAALTKVHEDQGRYHLVATNIVHFTLDAGAVLPEIVMWPFLAEVLGKEAAIDGGMFKMRGEVLVSGAAYPPGGPKPVCQARVKLGTIDKAITVVGRRVWKRGVSTAPEPFERMPLVWENAYGGPTFKPNPIGKGHAQPTEPGTEWELPNLEDPKQLIKAQSDHPIPANFGAVDFTWPQRFDKLGTYDQEWLKTRFPGHAKDMDPTVFNTSLPDQWLKEYFRGDETFKLENLHPTRPVIEGRLPGLTTRVFVTHKPQSGDERFREIPMRLDTVHLFPNADRGVLIFRGVFEVEEDDAGDILHMLSACERIGERKPEEHYRTVLAQRLDKETGALHSLRDKDLLPNNLPAVPITLGGEVEAMKMLIASEGLMGAHAREGAALKLEAAREKVRELGKNPDDYVPKELPPQEAPPDPEDLAFYMEGVDRQVADIRTESEGRQQEAEAQRAQVEAQARKLCTDNGVDYDAILAKNKGDGAGPPKFTAEGELERMNEMLTMAQNGGVALPEVEAQLRDPELRKKLEKAEEAARMSYRMTAHWRDPAAALDPERSAELRVELSRKRASGEPVGALNLTGADLSGMDLSGMDLTEAWLESTDLSGADLSATKLDRAVLAHANLTETKLAGASLHAANLGATTASNTDFSGAGLENAIFDRARLIGTKLRDTSINGASFLETVFEETDISGARGDNLLFLKLELRGVSFNRCTFTKASFLECQLIEADFSEAIFYKCSFVGTNADGAVFDRATLTNCPFAAATTLVGASFFKAKLLGINTRGLDLRRADFTQAKLDGSDLSETDLTEASFDFAIARDARFAKANLTRARFTSANLMGAILQGATAHGTSFEDANLFRADLLRIKVNGSTVTKDAYMTQMRFIEDRGPRG